MFVCVCMCLCVCAQYWKSLKARQSFSLFVCVRELGCVCVCARVCGSVTLMTGVRCVCVLICWAAAAMLAMVFRWFICDIAMATDAGGNPTGSRGWGIIMKGRSIPDEG